LRSFDLNKLPSQGTSADVPWLGNLFKSKLRNSSKRELLVFVTPRIISDKNGTR